MTPPASPSPAPAPVTDTPGRLLRIQEVSAETGLTPRTIRYYEELGLLAPAARSDGSYRLYDADDLERLRFIRGLRDDAGFSLAEIGQLLEDEQARTRNREHFRATADPAERRALVLDNLARGLHRAGHDVTLYCTDDSTCAVPRHALGPSDDRTGRNASELVHAQERIKAKKFSIYGVEIGSVQKLVENGKKLADYRADITLRALKKAQAEFQPK